MSAGRQSTAEPMPTVTLRHLWQPWREWWAARPALKLRHLGAPILTDEQAAHVRRMIDELTPPAREATP